MKISRDIHDYLHPRRSVSATTMVLILATACAIALSLWSCQHKAGPVSAEPRVTVHLREDEPLRFSF